MNPWIFILCFSPVIPQLRINHERLKRELVRDIIVPILDFSRRTSFFYARESLPTINRHLSHSASARRTSWKPATRRVPKTINYTVLRKKNVRKGVDGEKEGRGRLGEKLSVEERPGKRVQDQKRWVEVSLGTADRRRGRGSSRGRRQVCATV